MTSTLTTLKGSDGYRQPKIAIFDAWLPIGLHWLIVNQDGVPVLKTYILYRQQIICVTTENLYEEKNI